MNDKTESMLQARFGRWRAQERRQAPGFERVWQRALVRQREWQRTAASWRRFGFAGAAGLTLVIAGWLAWRPPTRVHAEVGREAWESLFAPLEQELASGRSGWIAPTDFLLAPAPGAGIRPISPPKQ